MNMLNKNQIEMYIRLDGDVDMYQRLSGKIRSFERMSDSEWNVIDDIVQRLILRHNNNESEKYAKETGELIEKFIRNENSISLLNKYCIKKVKKKSWWKPW